MITLLGALAIAYVAIAAVLYFSQRSFIYPAPTGPGAEPAGFETVQYTTADGLDLRAGHRPAADGRPTILYFHGNAADWQSSAVATDRLTPSGYGVLAAEYRGYRGNPGKPSEAGLYADGRAAIAWLAGQGVPPSELIIIGNSIGSGVASQMAAEVTPRALVLISPFASLSQLVHEKLRFLPTSVLLKDHFRNDDKLAQIDAPIVILHGTADTLIPIHHARQLAAQTDRAKLIEFENIGHDLAWYDPAEMALLRFLEDLPPQENR
ncbi:MAG: alpha/beta fold hydrolase [Erythrobacter sp.]